MALKDLDLLLLDFKREDVQIKRQIGPNASFDLDGLNVTDAYIGGLLLNGSRYPYSNFGTNYATKTYTKWYHEYLNFL